MEEREIDLIDLIADVLSHWRGILVAMILGAILLGGFSYFKSAQSVNPPQNVVEVSPKEQLAKLEESLTEVEKAAVLVVIGDEAECSLRQQYAQNSVLMQMDPFNVARIELVYAVQADDMEQSCMVSSVYELLLNGVGLYEWVEEQTGISATDARELIASDERLNVEALDEGSVFDFKDNSIKIVISHTDQAECQLLAEAVKLYVESQQKELSSKLGKHKMTLLSESAAVTVDRDILDIQADNLESMVLLLDTYAKKKDAFTANQKSYYELLTKQEVEESTDAAVPVVQSAPSVSVKYMLVGAVLFAVLYAVVVAVLYVLNGKLRATDELQSLYHIPQMGLVVKDSKKQFFVDKWIKALRNHGKRQFTAEQSMDLAATAVKISAAKNELDSICLIGCDMKAGADDVCKKLKTALEKEKLAVTVLDNVLYDAEAMEKLEAVKGVVLVEKAGSTMYREIADELELAKRQGIKVLGGIVVE